MRYVHANLCICIAADNKYLYGFYAKYETFKRFKSETL